MAEFVKVARLSELEPRVLKGLKINDKAIAVVLVDGKVHAFSDTCTHYPCSISPGEVEPNNTLLCWCHYARFDLFTGAVKGGPPEEPLAIYEVRVDGDDIEVALP